MRQHAIPQNILDVEFKLFTRFTIKEFGYLAGGIGIGGVFLYFVAGGQMPGIIGIPIFIVTSLAGIILALVPINDQSADVYIKNYVNAINRPTRRVWLNKEMQEERSKPEVKPGEDGTLIQKGLKEGAKIIGGSFLDRNKTEEENEKEGITQEKDKTEEIETIPVEQSPKPINPELVQLNNENINNYQIDIQSLDKLPGNISIWLSTPSLTPVPNVVTYLRDKTGKVLYANKTGPNGYFLTNKEWDEGQYTVDFQHPQYKFPKLEILLTKEMGKKPIKITTL